MEEQSGGEFTSADSARRATRDDSTSSAMRRSAIQAHHAQSDWNATLTFPPSAARGPLASHDRSNGAVPAPKRDRDTRPETFRPVLRRSENDAAAHRSSTSSLRFSLGDILDIKRPNSTRVRYSQTKIAPDTRAPDHPVGRGYARPDPSGIGSSGLDRADDLAEGGFRKRL